MTANPTRPRVLALLASLLLVIVMGSIAAWLLLTPAREEQANESIADDRSATEEELDALIAVQRNAPNDSELVPTVDAPRIDEASEWIIKGRLLSEAAAAITGAKLLVYGHNADLSKPDKNFGWEDLTAYSDEDGRFTLRFAPQPTLRLRMVVEGRIWVRRDWLWKPGELTATTDLGDIVMEQGGRLYGRILDEAGVPILGFRNVYVSILKEHSGQPPRRQGFSGNFAAGSAEYEVLGVPAGSLSVKADWGHYIWSEGTEVELAPGEEKAVDLIYKGPSLARRIVITPHCPKAAMYSSRVAAMELHGAPDGPRTLKHAHGSGSMFVFDDLPPGTYRAVMIDPRFVPTERGGLEPGHGYRMDVEANSALELTVLDAGTEAPIENYALTLREVAPVQGWSSETLRALSDPAPAGGVYRGLLEGTWLIEVSAPDYAKQSVQVEPCQANEQKQVTVRLSKPSSLAARVVDADGAPLPNVTLRLWPALVPDPNSEYWIEAQRQAQRGRRSSDLREGRSDADGNYRFDAISAGSYELEAWIHAEAYMRVSDIHVGSGAAVEIEARFEALGVLEVEVLLNDQIPLRECTILLTQALELQDPLFGAKQFARMSGPRNMDRLTAGLDAQGRVRFSHVPSGTWIVILQPTERPEEAPRILRARVVLGLVELKAGERASQSYDLRHLAPCQATVRIFQDGQPVEGARAELKQVESEQRLRNQWSLTAHTDAKGIAQFEGLLPGTWLLHASTPGGTWKLSPPREVEITSDSTASFVVEVALISGPVLVLDQATGTPIKNRLIRFASQSGSVEVTTDENGIANLTIAPGRHFVRDVASEQALREVEAPQISWPPAPGVEATVRIPLAH